MLRLILLLFLLFSAWTQAHAVVVVPNTDTISAAMIYGTEPMLTLDDIRTLRNREIGEKLGRRLSLGESIALGIIRGKMKRQERREARRARRNARRAERGLPPLSEEVDKSTSWLALGSLVLFLLTSLIGLSIGAAGLGLLNLVSLIGMLVFGGQGRRIYRGVDEGAFGRSSFAFWTGIVVVGLVAFAFLFLVATFGAV
ncbi:MAG: hypothetical protein AAGF87_17980 [Bacteroidota bacterium]